MCRSQAEGGQRCHGNAAKALAAAEKRMVEANTAYLASRCTQPHHQEVFEERTRRLDEWHDAVVVYASTPQGRADLEQRLATAPKRWDPYDSPHLLPDYHIEEALHRGKWLRERNEAVRKAVQAAERRTNPYAPKNRKTVTTAHKAHAEVFTRKQVQAEFDALATQYRTELATAWAEKHRREPRGDDARRIRWQAEDRAREAFPAHIAALAARAC